MARSFLSDCLTATCRPDLLRTEQSQSMATRNGRRNFFFFLSQVHLFSRGKTVKSKMNLNVFHLYFQKKNAEFFFNVIKDNLSL